MFPKFQTQIGECLHEALGFGRKFFLAKLQERIDRFVSSWPRLGMATSEALAGQLCRIGQWVPGCAVVAAIRF